MPALTDTAPAALLFDMDGTLIESERHLIACSQAACDELGLVVDPALWLSMIGLSDTACRAMLLEHLREDQLEALATRTHALYEARVDAGLPLRPGARPILEWAAALPVPIGLVTSTRRGRTERKLARCGLRHYFDDVVTGSDVAVAKPDPAIYLLAADRLGVPPGRCIVLEDSVPGVRAALAAGMAVIQVPDMAEPEGADRRLGQHVVASLDEARARLEPRFAPA